MPADTTELIKTALVQELEELHKEVHQAAAGLSEQELWRRPVEPGNSVGHLILHLTGNLNYFVGNQLGGSGYVRDREREFTETQPLGKAELLANLEAAVAVFRRVVGSLTAGQLAATHPTEKFGNVAKALVHLVTHFATHRGQISYIVRLVQSRR
jgi:uncharacterized damage-inducible protein DinB